MIKLLSSARFKCRSVMPLAALAFALALALPAQAARVLAVTGEVTVQRGDVRSPLAVGARLAEGDELVSTQGSEALVRFDDGARMALRSDSSIQFKELRLKGPASKRQKTIAIVKGGLRYISGKATVRQRVSFASSTATIGIRGTDIEISVAPEAVNDEPTGTYLKVNAGAATLLAVDGTQVNVDPGQVAFGGEPELVPRGAGGKRRPAGRKLEMGADSIFKTGSLDRLMR